MLFLKYNFPKSRPRQREVRRKGLAIQLPVSFLSPPLLATIERLQALEDGRVGVVEEDLHRVGSQVREVIPGEFFEGGG